jgi:uncharacterized iron-regulated protein
MDKRTANEYNKWQRTPLEIFSMPFQISFLMRMKRGNAREEREMQMPENKVLQKMLRHMRNEVS